MGTVTLSAPGYTSAATQINASGVATITIPADTFTSIGNITISATYSGDMTYATDVVTTSVQVTYIPVLTPNLVVTPASSSINSNDALNINVTVTGASTAEASPTGTVTLTVAQGDAWGTVVFTSSAQPLAGGVYLFTIPANTMSGGINPTSYVQTVSYSGDPYYFGVSNVVYELVTESAFSFTAPPTVPTISEPGGSTTAAVTVNAVAGYTGTVTLSCFASSGPANSGADDEPTCIPPSGSVAMGGTAIFTVNTMAFSSAALAYPKLPGKGWAGVGGGAVLALLLFLGMPARRHSWRSILGLLLMMAALGGVTSCGGGGSASSGGASGTCNSGAPLGGACGDPGTAAGTYTFTVSGTGNPAITTQPLGSFSVLVN